MGLQQSQASFPYDVGEQVYQTTSKWELHKGTRKADGSSVSVFLFDVTKNGPQAEIARNAMKRIKTLRFPSLLGFLDGVEMETTFYIVTEEVVPIQDALRDIKKHSNAISLGLYQLLQALSFLNGDCKLVHGNVTMDSIFVNKAGDWKLGSFDLICSLAEAESIFRKYHDIVPQKYKPPEVLQARWPKIQRSAPHTIDMWMLGSVIYELYNGPFDQPNEIVNAPKAIPKVLAVEYKRLFSPSLENRPEPSDLLSCKYFSNSLVLSCAFLENIALKEAHEKEEFFRQLPSEMEGFPKNVCTYKMLPNLVTALDYGYANSRALAPLLKIGSLLSTEEYANLITPSVVKWFASNDREMRMNLLSGLESFVEHLSPTLINQSIFPNITTGFTDISPKLRELTIRSVVLLAPKLNARVINGEVLRYFAKLQMDKEDYIRTNTTICLGRVARYLDEPTRKKVLVPAFSRALRDPFGPARLAGVMAFGATHEWYDADDIAKRVVPALSYLSVDLDKQVRVAALQKLKMFVEKLEKASLQMPEIATAGVGQQQQQQNNEQVASGSLLGWAFGSISKTIYGEGQEHNQATQLTPASTPTELRHPQPMGPALQAPPRQSPAIQNYGKDSDGEMDDERKPKKEVKKKQKKKPLVVRLENAAAVNNDWDAWNDDDGWNDNEDGSKSKESDSSWGGGGDRQNKSASALRHNDVSTDDWNDNGDGWNDADDWGDNNDSGGAWDADDDKYNKKQKKSSTPSSPVTPAKVRPSNENSSVVSPGASAKKSISKETLEVLDNRSTSPVQVDKAPSKGMGLGGLKKPTATTTTKATTPSAPQIKSAKTAWDGWGEEEKAPPSSSSKMGAWDLSEKGEADVGDRKSSLSFAAEDDDSGAWGEDGDDWNTPTPSTTEMQTNTNSSAKSKDQATSNLPSAGDWGDEGDDWNSWD